jgi:hypothetical protein
MCQKRLDLLLTHILWVPLVVIQDKTLYPAKIGLLGTDTIVKGLNTVSDLIQ